MRKISLLGASGSIGAQTIDVINTHREDFALVGLSVGRNINYLKEVLANHQPKIVSVQNKEDAQTLAKEYPSIRFTFGSEGLIEVATEETADVLVNAVIGSVGLEPTLQAIEAGKVIALANKETLVTAGHLVMNAAKEKGVPVLPIDSEHSAIYQCLNGENPKDMERLVITASGGSFRDLDRSHLANVTVEDALNHPNWSMGAKITIDSATMMNKGLEVIEAHWLFDMPYEKIDCLLHKESVIHSMVEFHDGSVMAQLGTPDMRVPIQYALTYPKRLPLPQTKRLRLEEYQSLNFKQMDFERYHALQLAFEAGKIGGTMTTVLNAANEVAVAQFLNKQISFLQIEEVIEKAMNRHDVIKVPTLEQIQEVDVETRRYVESLN